MKALVVYASWFGYNRAIAKAITDDLTQRGITVACAPISKVEPSEVAGFDILVLGTYTHLGHASKRMCDFCAAIPQRWLDRVAVAVFGTQLEDAHQRGEPGGVDALLNCLAARGCQVATQPLRWIIPQHAALRRWSQFTPQEVTQIQMFTNDLYAIGEHALLV
jgi:menaquinone-dependent protoporphyrinogen IX oxidase